MRSFLYCTLALLALTQASIAKPDAVMIRLVDPLDEPEFYCIDIPGFRQNVKLEAPLMAHTLKRFGSADEMWILDYPSKGQIFASEYGLCIEAASASDGADLMLKKPSDSTLQRFNLTDSGTLVLSNHPKLGFAVKDGKGDKTGGPSHLRRDLRLKTLSEADSKLTTWKLIKDASNWPD